MHFDDRLDTVLRLPDSGDGLARIQYRQLIDILGRLPASAASDALEAGFARLARLSERIPAAEQARLLRQPLQPITNTRLIAVLAQDEPGVATGPGPGDPAPPPRPVAAGGSPARTVGRA
ncbi:MAG: hypothetical protein P8Y58_03650 [Novosphingobium sp.]